MKNNKLILFVIIIGVLTLFFFPEPETNFILYVLTGLVFLGLVVWLVMRERKKFK